MNSKKLLSMLLISLGAFSVVLTGCDGKKDNSPSDVPSSSTSETENSASASASDSTSVSESISDSESVESSTVSESTITDSSSVEEEDPNLLGQYDVTFNYDDAKSNLVVWTNEAIEKSVAPYTANISELDEIATMRTIPTTAEGGTRSGMYYFLINDKGEIAYASYGLGNGYGSPCDGYYHNGETKNIYEAEYWALHEKYELWGTNVKPVEINGVMVNPWNLYDLVIPDDWFGIKGYYNEPTMKALWKVISNQNSVPLADNSYLEATITPKALNHFYVSINENKQLEIREREAGVTDTPNIRYTPTDDDALIPYVAIESVAEAADDTKLDLVKGVVTYKTDKVAIIADEKGDAVLVNSELADVVVGDTVSLSATKTTVNEHVALKDVTKVEKVERYGKLPQVERLEVTEENVTEMMAMDNNYAPMKLTKAEVISMDANGKSIVKIGETEITLYKTTFPATVSVGDCVDVIGSMIAYKDQVQLQVASAEDISRYYNVSVDVDGVEGVEEPVISAHATGDKVVLSASTPDNRYQFSHWEMLTKDAEGNDVWENVGTDVELEITVGEADVSYRAAFTYSAWTLLPNTYGNVANLTPAKLNSDAGGDAYAVVNDANAIIHQDGGWDKGILNANWRLVVVVDKDGKVAFAVRNPANGYGGPNGTGYYAHPDYVEAGYENNPAFNLLEGYGPWSQEDPTPATKFEIVVPEGGFIITAHGTGTNDILALFGIKNAIEDKDLNKAGSLDANVRLFYDAVAKQVRVFAPSVEEGNYVATLNENGYLTNTGIGIFVDNESNTYTSTKVEGRYIINNLTVPAEHGGMKYTIAVDEAGKIIYASYGLANGYGSPADDFYSVDTIGKSSSAQKGTVVGDIFALGDNYASWSEWFAAKDDPDRDTKYAYGNYEFLVPTGGFVITGSKKSEEMVALWTEIFSKTYSNGSELAINTAQKGLFDDVKVELVTINGVAQIKVTGGHGYVNPNLPTAEELYSMENYTVAPFGSEATDVYSEISVVENAIHVTATKQADKVFVVNEIGDVFTTTLAEITGGYSVTVNGEFDYTSAFYVVSTYDAEGYKSIAYHKAGGTTFTNNDALIEQVGSSLKVSLVNGTNYEFTWDGLVGAYTLTFHAPKWTNFSLNFNDGEAETAIWYDNTTITGAVVDSARVGDQWNGGWFIDSDACIAAHQWMNSNDGGLNYTVVYDPANNTLTVKKA